MPDLLHLAEIAVLMLAAYQVGWFLGFVLRRILVRPAPAVVDNAVPADRLAAAKKEPEPPVRAPVIAPLASAPIPSPAPKVPLEEAATAPLPDAFLADLQSAMLEPAPARSELPPGYAAASAAAAAALEAALDLKTVQVATDAEIVVLATEPEVSEAPVPDAELAVKEPVDAEPPPPEDDSAAVAVAVAVTEATAPAMVEVAVEALIVAAPPSEPEVIVPVPEAPRPGLKPANKPGEAWSGHRASRPRPPAPPPPPAPPAPTPVTSSPPPVTPPPDLIVDEGEASDEDAEAAAMRAIEGGWTRKLGTRKPNRDLPEGVPPGKRR